MPDKGQSPFKGMNDITISENGVLKLLKNLNPYKASGPDQISTRFLRMCASEITPALTLLYQSSLNAGTVPSDWKEALVTPLFKKGDRTAAANYRPVSLTSSVVSKILEHIIHSTIMKHLDNLKILTDCQHGFRSKRSCESQLISTIQGISEKLKTGRDQVDIILLDFAKAFDKVPHRRLVYKLDYYGVRGMTLKWISSFLSSHSQQVMVEGCTSGKLDVLSGVPQGTVLGPLLFLIYINDLPESVKSSTVRLFADDSLLYRHVRKPTDADDLQRDLTALEQWEHSWQMSFHPSKCTVLRISTNRNNILKSNYTLHGHQLEVVDSSKYLGITLSQDLSWRRHVETTAGKASKTLGFLRRNFRDCSKSVRETTYHSMVRPTLEYASAAWDPYKSEDINRLDKVQRRGARYVHNNYRDRNPGCVTNMIHELGWETLQQCRKHHRLTIMYKTLNGLICIPEADNILKKSDTRTRGSNRLRQTYTKAEVYNQSFFPRTIRDWNKLPTSVTDSTSLDDLKASLAAVALNTAS